MSFKTGWRRPPLKCFLIYNGQTWIQYVPKRLESYPLEIAKKEIQGFEPFSNLDNDEFIALFEGASVIQYSKGEVILRPDEMPQGLYIVLKGIIRILGQTQKLIECTWSNKDETRMFFL